MHAGQLTERVEIQKPTQSTGNGGQPTVTWSRYDHRWADVNTESVKEKMQGDRPEKQARWKIMLRYDANIDSTYRVIYGSKTFEISGVSYDKRKRWMFLICHEEQ